MKSRIIVTLAILAAVSAGCGNRDENNAKPSPAAAAAQNQNTAPGGGLPPGVTQNASK